MHLPKHLQDLNSLLLDSLRTRVKQSVLPILSLGLGGARGAMPKSYNFLKNPRISVHTLKCIDSFSGLTINMSNPTSKYFGKELRETSTLSKV